MKKAIISDIDGTLALIGQRDPYNPDTVKNDLSNKAVAGILQVYSRQKKPGVGIILLTGRYERYRKETEDWLGKHRIRINRLFMRSDGDTRPDFVFKREIYERHIRGIYEVLFVLEDRNRMVDMWRNELGLTCLQVGYGDF